MSDIKIHVLHTGAVSVSPDLPFGGDHCNAIKASGIFQPRENRLWLPVSAYLIEHPKGLFLVDTAGWFARIADPEGEVDLGGIAKGWIADRLVELAAAQNAAAKAALVGGDGRVAVVG